MSNKSTDQSLITHIMNKTISRPYITYIYDRYWLITYFWSLGERFLRNPCCLLERRLLFSMWETFTNYSFKHFDHMRDDRYWPVVRSSSFVTSLEYWGDVRVLDWVRDNPWSEWFPPKEVQRLGQFGILLRLQQECHRVRIGIKLLDCISDVVLVKYYALQLLFV